ncbi:major capsid protein E [Nocardia cyriacigeorgica]|uniref:major capsid protein n=1 Tax=Nocardia cyriacigeorgica TaxID=135487 RepID=UPI0013B987EE|nr:major capsid protein [Nocardia cyriacigeorgica]NEW49339.1 major capsid protein E [Nocardia cyriacigeorgica]
MALWTDLLTPAELTGYARASLEAYEQQKGTLARWLPNRTVPDIVVRLVVGQDGLVPTAEYRSYDAETPIGDLPGGQRKTVELPPLGRKFRIGEYEQLRIRANSDEQMVLALERVTDRAVKAVANRVEIARGQAIETAALSISENGFVQTGTWARNAGHTATAPILWSTSATAKPLDDLLAFRATYVDTTGEEPGAIALSSRVVAALQRTAEFRALAATVAGTPSIVSAEAVQQVLAAHSLPPIHIYDRKVNVAGTPTKVLSDNKIFMLPAPVDPTDAEGTDLGGTYWGETLESSEPGWGIAESDRPGIVIGATKTDDPIAAWIRSAAIALPVLANADLSFVGTVL